MDSILKAKVIIELLDDRKYSVLSSFSNDELNKMNGVALEDLNGLGAADINLIITEFLASVDSRATEKSMEDNTESDVAASSMPTPAEVQTLAPINAEDESSDIVEKPLTIEEKIQQQPIQLLACALEQLSDDKKDVLLGYLSEEKKKEIESSQVEKTPITDQIVNILLKELDLAN